MTTVTIDIGNSFTKVEYWGDCGILRKETCKKPNPERIGKQALAGAVDGIIICSVKKGVWEFFERLDESVSIPVILFDIEEIRKYYGPLNYKGNLGADRMAAVLGANVLFPGEGKLVVDLGTAMTLDVADAKGIFQGGNISIGLFTRMKALAKSTSLLPEVEDEDWEVGLGHDTKMAISKGAMNGVVGEILFTLEGAEKEFGVKKCILTGGDSEGVYKILKDKKEVEIDPFLLGRGLDHHLRKHYLQARQG